MLIGREAECKQLEELYESDRNNLVVLYGRRGIGKTAAAREFMKEKPAAYYMARECTDREQLSLISKEWGCSEDNLSMRFMYHELIEGVLQKHLFYNKKVIIVFDEFHLIVKENKEFAGIINDIIQSDNKVMFLFMSSSVNWIENNMVNELGMASRCISGLIKLKELNFADIVEYFPKMTVEQCIYCNAAIGGVPGYMHLWQENKSVKENLYRLFFTTEGELYNEAENLLKTELRELTAYNAILTALAAGKYKLNDIHDYTGFSRAKISVYIKNLMQLDVVEKVFSFETGDRENIQKGLYRIKDNYLNFWYRYVYPFRSLIESGRGKDIYNAYFLPEVSEYMRRYFSQVCEEFLRLSSRYKRLSYVYDSWGGWYGKNGMIDIIGKDEKEHYIAGICSFKAKPAGEGLLNECSAALSFAGISASEIYLFARNGFTNDFNDKIRNDKSVVLIDLKEL